MFSSYYIFTIPISTSGQMFSSYYIFTIPISGQMFSGYYIFTIPISQHLVRCLAVIISSQYLSQHLVRCLAVIISSHVPISTSGQMFSVCYIFTCTYLNIWSDVQRLLYLHMYLSQHLVRCLAVAIYSHVPISTSGEMFSGCYTFTISDLSRSHI